MDWSLSAGFFLLVILQAFTVGENIHHNLPDNLEIIDPKSLGLSGTDLENFLGNVKLLPIEGGSGGLGPKTQILTVGFDGNEKLNLDDFASLSTAGLADNDKTVAEMAFRKFQDFFKNPNTAQQFDEQTTPGATTTYFPSSTTTTGENTTPQYSASFDANDSTEKPKKKRIRIHKRPVFSSTFKSVESNNEETSTEAYKPSTFQDYARVLQEMQTKTPTTEGPLAKNTEQSKYPVYRPFPNQQQQQGNGEQNQASSQSPVGFSNELNTIYNNNNQQNQVPREEMTYFNPATYDTTSQSPSPHHHQKQQNPEQTYFLRSPPHSQSLIPQQAQYNNEHQQKNNQQQQPNFPPVPETPQQQQSLSLGPAELQGFPSFQNEVAPYFPQVKFETPRPLASFPPSQNQQQQQQQNNPQYFQNQQKQETPQLPHNGQQQQQDYRQNNQQQQNVRQEQPSPPPQQQQQQNGQQPRVVHHNHQQQQYHQQERHPQTIHHVQHITPLKADFQHETQKPAQSSYYPQQQQQQYQHNQNFNRGQQFQSNREQKSVFPTNNNFQQQGNQQQQVQQQQPKPEHNNIQHTTSPSTTTAFNFPSHNRFRVNGNNVNLQTSFNQGTLATTPRPPFSPSFQVTPSTPLIPIATVENAMNAYKSQYERHMEKMHKEAAKQNNKPPVNVNDNFNTFNNNNNHNNNINHHSTNEIRNPFPNNDYRQQSNVVHQFQVQHNPPPTQFDGFSNDLQQNYNRPLPPHPPPLPSSFQQLFFPQQNQNRPPPPPRPEHHHRRPQPPQQPAPFTNYFTQQSQDNRQHAHPPPLPSMQHLNFRGPPPPLPFRGPFNNKQHFRQPPPPKIYPSQPNPNPIHNFNREPRVNHHHHRTPINNSIDTVSLRQFPPAPSSPKHNFNLQVAPSTNFRHLQSSNYNFNRNHQYRTTTSGLPPSQILHQSQAHPVPVNLLRPHESQTQNPVISQNASPIVPQNQNHQNQQIQQSASVEVATVNRPPTSTVLRFPISNTAAESSSRHVSGPPPDQHHQEAALYAQSMGLQVHSIKPSPLLTSFRL